jgi:hypothetical protein
LRKKLLSFEKPVANVESNPRRFGELRITAENLRQADARREEEAKRRKHIEEMEELSKREAQTWQEIEKLLQSGYTASNYHECAALLSNLQELSEFEGESESFNMRLKGLAEKYKGRPALIGRWKRKGLL